MPFWVLTNLVRKQWNVSNGVLVCADQEGHQENSPELWTPVSTTNGKLFREAKVCGEATKALQHFSCDVCDLLKQPPGRRQVAIAHAVIFNDVVTRDVNVWKLRDSNSRERTFL